MGEKIVSVLTEFLKYTSTAPVGHEDRHWQQGHVQHLPSWQLFEVVGDFGESDQTELLNKLSPWARLRPMAPDHPKRNEKGFREFWKKSGRVPSLQCYTDYVQAMERAERITAKEAGRKLPRKSAGLQYSDLYGVPTILVLCEKGRMGDTFPHTFTCQDQHLRSGQKYSTLIQELGRLCRHPSVHAEKLLSKSALHSTGPEADKSSVGMCLLKQALQEAYGVEEWPGATQSVWTNMVNAIAAASSLQLKELIKALHGGVAQCKAQPSANGQTVYHWLQGAAQAVLDMPGVGHILTEGNSLVGIVDELDSKLRVKSDEKPLQVLLDSIKLVTDWRQGVLTSLDGSGYPLGNKAAPEFKGGLPVRVMVNGRFEKDCLDSNDLVELFCCCPADSALLHGNAISVARHRHVLPYALVGQDFAKQLLQVQQATVLKQEGATQQILRQAAQLLSEDVMENWPTGGKVDKFMVYTKPGLRGSPVHDYRDAASACNKHYDTHKFPEHVHKGRFLLKAEPQQGKTGAYIGLLQQLGTILEPGDKWQPAPAAPVPQPRGLKPREQWCGIGSALRWQHSCFEDIKQGQWRSYKKLRPGKYADRVAMQRTLLLASVCHTQAQQGGSDHNSWAERYKELLIGVRGENICTETGRRHAEKTAQDLECFQNLPLEVTIGPDEMTICIVNSETVKKAINWDSRVEEAATMLANDPQQLGSLAAGGFGTGIRMEAHRDAANRNVIALQDAECIQAVESLSRRGAQGSVQYNLVQEALWPQTPFVNSDAEATEDAPDANDLPGSWTSAAAHRSPMYLPQNGHMAHSMRIGRVLRPVPMSSAGHFKLEARVPELNLPEDSTLFHNNEQSSNLLAASGPVFLATAAAWDKLEKSSEHQLKLMPNKFQFSERPCAGPVLDGKSIRHWIFVPSYNRYGDENPRQMCIDWADAVSHDTPYVRVIVVRSEAEQIAGYSRLLRDHQLQVEMHLPDIPHVTLLMVMPARIDLSQLPQRHAKLLPYQRQELIQAMGIGYARLCIQLVSRLMGMSSIWTLDDNLSDCWRLPFENFVSSGGQHSQPEPVSFDTVMKTIEQQTLRATARASKFGSSDVVTELLKGQIIADAVIDTPCQERQGPADAAPRPGHSKQLGSAQQAQHKIPVRTMADLTGDQSTYGVIGIDLNIRDANQVGLNGPGCPGPWSVTPSVYSMLYIDVASTVQKGALYPAKPYHEDVDFAHLCEERQLVVVKCNWLFFHKARLTSDFIWTQTHPEQASKLTLLHPADNQIHSGQLIRFSAPSSLGRPVTVTIGSESFLDLKHVVCEETSDEVGLSVYVACMVCVPDLCEGQVLEGHLSVTFQEVGGTTLRTQQPVEMHRLYPWQTGQAYTAPFKLPLKSTTSSLGYQSQTVQLLSVLEYIKCLRQNDAKPLLLCDGQDDVSTEFGFQPFMTGLQEAGLHRQSIVWLSNNFLLGQQPRELGHTLGQLAAVPMHYDVMRSHGIHHVIMRYSLANAPCTVQEVQNAFQQASASFVVKSVFTTAKPDFSSCSQPLALGAIADHRALPYMLVVFEVGLPPTEAAGKSSLRNLKRARSQSPPSQSDMIGVTELNNTATYGRQPSVTPPRHKSAAAQAATPMPDIDLEQQASNLAAAGSSQGLPFASPPDTPQKTTPQDFWIPRIDAIVTVLKEAGRMQRKGIISALRECKEEAVQKVLYDLDPANWVAKALQEARKHNHIQTDEQKKNKWYWVDT